jgi:hypothetical protein
VCPNWRQLGSDPVILSKAEIYAEVGEIGAAPAASPKRIVREGENFVLPDGTRVAAD